MKRPLSLSSVLLPFLAFGLASCASGSPMLFVPVDVEPATVFAQVYLHEDLDGYVLFDPVRASRTRSANLLDVQCRITNNSRDVISGTYVVEFFDRLERQLSSTGSRPYSMMGGAAFMIKATAGVKQADRIVISVRP